jgi:hypothetical protein
LADLFEECGVGVAGRIRIKQQIQEHYYRDGQYDGQVSWDSIPLGGSAAGSSLTAGTKITEAPPSVSTATEGSASTLDHTLAEPPTFEPMAEPARAATDGRVGVVQGHSVLWTEVPLDNDAPFDPNYEYVVFVYVAKGRKSDIAAIAMNQRLERVSILVSYMLDPPFYNMQARGGNSTNSGRFRNCGTPVCTAAIFSDEQDRELPPGMGRASVARSYALREQCLAKCNGDLEELMQFRVTNVSRNKLFIGCNAALTGDGSEELIIPHHSWLWRQRKSWLDGIPFAEKHPAIVDRHSAFNSLPAHIGPHIPQLECNLWELAVVQKILCRPIIADSIAGRTQVNTSTD